MLLGLIVVVLIVVVVQTRQRLGVLQRRIERLEGQAFAAEAVERTTVAPAFDDLVARENTGPVAPDLPSERVIGNAPQPDAGLGRGAGEAIAEPAPIAPLAPVEEARPSVLRRISFEDLFGRRLPIWAGGITLAVAGMLIVKYSIDAGLLSPLVRVICGLLFGGALIGGAEAARRNSESVGDPRVAQALAGAGIASLYASVLVAANLYHLIAPLAGFVGLAGVTALAMGLSLRFGAPSALLGLVGGLAAPALVGSAEPNIPLLTTYLALAIGGLCTLSRGQRWAWLGIGALIGGFGWGSLLVLRGALDAAASISIGLFLVLIGVGLPLLVASGTARRVLRTTGAVLAALQIAVLIALGGFELLHWGLFGLISIAIGWLAWRESDYAELPLVGAVIAPLLLAVWPVPQARDFALVGIALAAIYAAPALAQLWSVAGRPVHAARIIAVALGGTIVAAYVWGRYDGSTDGVLAAVALVAALLAGGGAALGWRMPARQGDVRFASLAATSALLAGIAAYYLLPSWTLAPVFAALGLALLLLSIAARDIRVEHAAWIFAAAGLALLAGGNGAAAEWKRAIGDGGIVAVGPALVRWAGLAVVAGLFAWRARWVPGGRIAQGIAALLGYGALAQFVPPVAQPLIAVLALAALAQASRMTAENRLLPAMGSLLAVSLLWAAVPLAEWLAGASLSLAGEPLLVNALPPIRDVLLRLLVPALLIGAAWQRTRGHVRREAGWAMIALAAPFALVAGHVLFKHVLALDGAAAFVRLGMAERTLWEAVLIAAGLAAWRFASRPAGIAIAATGLAHFAVYTVLLHNPLWAGQAVGGVPLLNWLLPAYGLPLAALWLFGRYEPALAARAERPRAIAQMLLILLLAASLLRQVFAGTILSIPHVSDAEDIARSVLAVALGVGFLLWGIRRSSRDWRIASLLLMLGAAGKVFLFDASGLDGLARIGSFVALGFSLIGIGWLYSRFLREDAPLTPPAIEP